MSSPDNDSNKASGQTGFDKLGDQIPIADFGYYVYTWPAWFVMPEVKRYVPVIRLAIGDLDGNILLKRESMLTGIVDLIDELASSLQKDFSFIKDFEGFAVEQPQSKEGFIEDLDGLIDRFSKIKEIVQALDWVEPILSGEADHASDSKK